MKLFILSFALVFCGCASTYWVKPGGSVQDYNQDAAFCRNDAYSRATNAFGQTDMYVQQATFQNCLISKGWHQQESK